MVHDPEMRGSEVLAKSVKVIKESARMLPDSTRCCVSLFYRYVRLFYGPISNTIDIQGTHKCSLIMYVEFKSDS